MDQVERDGASRSHNIVYTLPRSVEALNSIISAQIGRIDTEAQRTQLIIFTPDTETTQELSRLVWGINQGREVKPTTLPVTSAKRAARLVKEGERQIVIGTPIELLWLIQRSLLKLEELKSVIIAFADETVSASNYTEEVEALDATFAEIPRDAGRIVTATALTPEVEQLIERHALKARHMTNNPPAKWASPADSSVVIDMRYITATPAARGLALQKLLDDLDPPSARIIYRSELDRPAIEESLRYLGYGDNYDAIGVSRDAIPQGVHTVIFFGTPAEPSIVDKAIEAQPVNYITIGTASEIERLRQVIPTIAPLKINASVLLAKRREQSLRDEIRTVIEQGITTREVIALESLLDDYEGVEIAAAIVRMLERTRAELRDSEKALRAASFNLERTEMRARGERSDRGDRGFSRDRGFDRGFDRGGGERSFNRDRGERNDRFSSDRFSGDRFSGDRLPSDRSPRGESSESRFVGNESQDRYSLTESEKKSAAADADTTDNAAAGGNSSAASLPSSDNNIDNQEMSSSSAEAQPSIVEGRDDFNHRRSDRDGRGDRDDRGNRDDRDNREGRNDRGGFRGERSDRSSRPRGDRPFGPRGDRPRSPRGDRPFSPRGDRPAGPRGDRPPSRFSRDDSRGERPRFSRDGDSRGFSRGEGRGEGGSEGRGEGRGYPRRERDDRGSSPRRDDRGFSGGRDSGRFSRRPPR